MEKLGAKYDISEIAGFDDLHDPREILAAGMERAAALWGASHTFFLVNGSTCGILAAIRAASRVSGSRKLILSRNCHKSVYNAVELCSLEPVYIAPSTIRGLGFCGSISEGAVEACVRENPGAPVILTSPTYEGALSNIAEISSICRRHGSILLVDEAHGAHLDLSPYFTGGAVRAGADIIVQSLHKTLTGLTQTALLHLGADCPVTRGDILRELAVFETSSPSYILMASIDGTVDLIFRRGHELFDAWSERLRRFHERLSLKNLALFGHSHSFSTRDSAVSGVHGFDKSKIVILCDGTNIRGSALMNMLRYRFGIECEMAGSEHVVAMSGLLDTNESLNRLADALCEIDSGIIEARPRTVATEISIPPRKMSASEALKKQRRPVPLMEASGSVCAEYVWAYPPGIPLVVPGEVLTKELLHSFIMQEKSGISLKSTFGDMPAAIHVIRDLNARFP